MGHYIGGEKKKWLKQHKYNECGIYHKYCIFITLIDTKASEKLSAIILNKHFCTDMKKISPVHQTSKCEAVHSLLITFAPKSMAFSYYGMLSRLV